MCTFLLYRFTGSTSVGLVHFPLLLLVWVVNQWASPKILPKILSAMQYFLIFFDGLEFWVRSQVTVCFECLLFKVTEPNSIPYRTHPACAKRAAYPDPPPVSHKVTKIPNETLLNTQYSNERRGIVEDMCYERRRAEACV